jgi:hypothetical protein
VTDGTPILLLLLVVAIYFLPTICAGLRGKANGTGGVFLVNLLLGWTVAGWIVSFIWACSGTTEADKRREEQRHRELLAAVGGNEQAIRAWEDAMRASKPAPATPPPRSSAVPTIVIVTVAILLLGELARPAHAQPTQTRCYQAGPTQVCETKDRTTGAVISSSRCYQSGSGQTCDTQNFGSSSSSSSGTVIPAPSFTPPRR